MAHGMTRRLKKLINKETDLLNRAAEKAKEHADETTDPEELREALLVLYDDLEGISESLRSITGGSFDSR